MYRIYDSEHNRWWAYNGWSAKLFQAQSFPQLTVAKAQITVLCQGDSNLDEQLVLALKIDL